ncbi:HPP family protein [Nibrella viscosa]
MKSLKPIKGANRQSRRRLELKDELMLAFAPTAVVLVVFAFVEILSRQRLLFASLASSAFLIYLDPGHGTNTVRTLLISQMTAAIIGLVTFVFLGPSYLAGGLAMILTIVLMIVADVVHPPAVATSLSFAFKAGNENNLILFALALGIILVLVLLQRFLLWLLTRLRRK